MPYAVFTACTFAFCCASCFIVQYARRSWRRSRVGVNLMAMSIAVMLLAILAGACWLLIALERSRLLPLLAPLSAIAWVIVGGGFIARTIDMRKAYSQKGEQSHER